MAEGVGAGVKDLGDSLSAEALARDATDPLRDLKREFLFPLDPSGGPVAYFAGNSLGLQPRGVRERIDQELSEWARWGVEGHFRARDPWLPYHETVTEPMARVVGALPTEVVVMNTLTVNLHLMLATFYRPTRERHRILMEASAFPSDQYAVESQARFHGYDPAEAIVEVAPRPGEDCVRDEDWLAAIEREGAGLALVLIGSVQYLTGQAFPLAETVRAARRAGARVGFDLAHGAGNLELRLHDDAPDFAVWCSYKYLNSGPGGLAGCFVHERHHSTDGTDPALPRLAGWWGHDKATRFQMRKGFRPIPTAEGWQLSNPPILPLAALRASLALFDRATMPALRAKSVELTAFLERALRERVPAARVATPAEPARRGAQLSLRVSGGGGRSLSERLAEAGVVADFREPDVLRVAPTPLYCSWTDCVRLVEALAEALR